jgi:hypothetical protein
MGALRCVDGSILTVAAVACRDRLGKPYEITLTLARDERQFAAIGERCGFRLARLAALVSAAREDPAQAAAWPDPDDRFPEPECEPGRPPGRAPSRAPGMRGPAVACLPGDREYFSLRARERTDLPGAGELRCWLRSSADWLGEAGAGRQPGQAGSARKQTGGSAGQAGGSARQAGGTAGWRLSRRAVLEAWGGPGIGLRAVLTSAELVTFLDTVLAEPGGIPLAGPAPGSAGAVRTQPGASRRSARRERGRVPDGTARTRLPAVRAPA